MSKFNVHQAKTHLSSLLQRVEMGEEVVIARAGKPVAKLVPYTESRRPVFGMDEGRFTVPDDFDAPLPDEVLRLFHGGDAER
jgi:prevent-host-death family protein